MTQPQSRDESTKELMALLNAPQRYAILYCTAELLHCLVRDGTPCTRVTGNRLPDDAKIVDAWYEKTNDRIGLLLESSTFALVPTNARFPILEPPQLTAFEYAGDAREYDKDGEIAAREAGG